MTAILFVVILIVVNQMKPAKEGEFHRDYLCKEKTTAINGIFVILIVISHAKQYIDIGGIYDDAYIAVSTHLNQMVVASFLFYSGYGMMESVKKKKFDYVKSVMTKRFWILLINFNLALCLYYVEGRLLGKTYTVKKLILSSFGWESIGNSSWYVFAILSLYIMFFVAFFIIRFTDNTKIYYVSALFLTLFIIAFVYFEMKMGRSRYTYNTVILFALGVWWSLLKNIIEKIVMKNDITYLITVALVLGVYFPAYFRRWSGGIEGYTVWAIAFTVCMILVTMKISFFNPILSWFGKHVFSIYILQRLPMYIFEYLGYNESHKYMFIICSFAVTVVLAVIFDKFTTMISKRLFGKNIRKNPLCHRVCSK